jgi:hypothetical protein
LLLFPLTVFADNCHTIFSDKALFEIKESQFAIENEQKRRDVAIKFLSCLGHENPDIRDGIVYEAMSYWLRNQQLDIATTKTLFQSLLRLLDEENRDKNNFTQPFAALVLSEVVRVDRITPYLSEKDRQTVVDISTRYMNNIKDYRGFSDTDGWRHAVAHTSDIFLQLALNRQITKEQLNQLSQAIAYQISPQHGHAYIHGEPKRLATAYAYIAARAEFSEAEIANQLNQFANPSPFNSWGGVYKSEAGLAKLHNTRAFIYSLVALSGQSKNPNLIAIQPTLVKIVQALG